MVRVCAAGRGYGARGFLVAVEAGVFVGMVTGTQSPTTCMRTVVSWVKWVVRVGIIMMWLTMMRMVVQSNWAATMGNGLADGKFVAAFEAAVEGWFEGWHGLGAAASG